MKKPVVFLLAILMIVVLAACGNDKASEKTQLGTSKLSITLPEGFVETEDDFDEDQVAYTIRMRTQLTLMYINGPRKTSMFLKRKQLILQRNTEQVLLRRASTGYPE